MSEKGESIDLGPRMCAVCVADEYWILFECSLEQWRGNMYQTPLSYRAFSWSDLTALADAVHARTPPAHGPRA